MYKVFDRISAGDNDLATIKFVGKLPDHIWGSNTVALGVEWDRPDRGKNNGEIEGISYFKTDVENAGSFLKASNKKIEKNRFSFVEQVLQQYSVSSYSEQNIHFGSKVVQELGLDKLTKIQANFANLTSVTLDHQLIDRSGEDLENFSQVLGSLSNLKRLDLGYNLVNDLNIIWEIIDALPQLEWLILNGNRFFELSSSDSIVSHNLQKLELSSTNISIEQVRQKILPKFPHLKELYLAGNSYKDSDIINLDLRGTNIELIDLSLNELTVVPIKIVSAKSINLNENHISAIPPECNLENVNVLDLRRNSIDEWSFIDQLYLLAPNLLELRINRNPVLDTLSIEEMTVQIIARFECEDHRRNPTKLFKLNGSPLNDDEITNAELYFISKVRQKEIIFKNEKRWKKLLSKHNIPDTFIDTNIIDTHWLAGGKRICLSLHFAEDNRVSRCFLRTYSVLRLKGIVSRFLGDVSILRLNLYFYVNEFDEDSNTKVKQNIDDDSSILDNFGFQQNQTIYVSIE
ncbi:uncharacterized protein RJT20DRAFT_98667 [Scheffersomyces xylosifermentans]|uniref:uncharacterized protein n=1 Tax=Scheffersomyces xylosifermentans TaxID=1304137 RepID=UPI00315CB3E9